MIILRRKADMTHLLPIIIATLICILSPRYDVGSATLDNSDILERAKKEREVTLYSTMPISEFPIFSQAAKEKYPFLNINFVRIGSAAQVSMVMLEHRSGKIQADV